MAVKSKKYSHKSVQNKNKQSKDSQNNWPATFRAKADEIAVLLAKKTVVLKKRFQYLKRLYLVPASRQAKKLVRKRPFAALSVLLLLLFSLIVAGNLIRKEELQTERLTPAKQVNIFAIGQAPKINLQGQVEKTGTLTILAQAGGIVQEINVSPGQKVGTGYHLLRLGSNYSGGNIPALQRNLAYQQYSFNQDNFEKQKEIIDRQKELAEKSVENAEELRRIGRQAVEEAESQLGLNESILSTIEENLSALESATQSAENDTLLLSTKQLKSQFLAAANQLRQMIRTNSYQTNEDDLPAQIANLQKEITLKQLEVQEKSLALNLEISRINYQIANLTASLMNPASPFTGTIEIIHVRPGQAVTPGQPLVSLTGETDQMDLVVKVSPSIAQKISKIEPTIINLPNGSVSLVPQHVTLQPLNDGQYRIIYHLPLEKANNLFDGQFLSLQVPLGYPDSPSSIPSIPIDAVYQLQEESFVYLVDENNRAFSRQIKLGQVLGSFVEVIEGLSSRDLLITSRNVNQGDPINFQTE